MIALNNNNNLVTLASGQRMWIGTTYVGNYQTTANFTYIAA